MKLCFQKYRDDLVRDPEPILYHLRMVEDPLGLTFIGNKQKLIHDLLESPFSA